MVLEATSPTRFMGTLLLTPRTGFHGSRRGGGLVVVGVFLVCNKVMCSNSWQ